MIIGRYRELLPDLNIDPMNSRLYQVKKYKIIKIINGETLESGDHIYSAYD